MRITTANAFDGSVSSLQSRQQDVNDAQNRLVTGKRVSRASDDPTAAARAERALAQTARSEADQRALDASRSAIQQVEGALGESSDLLQSARELIVAAGNASYSDTERANLGQRLKGIRDQLLVVANRGDGTGGYLFGGQGASLPPFVDAAGGVQYRGSGGQTIVPASDPLPTTQDGSAVWLAAPSGNGVFETNTVAGNSGGAWIDQGRVVDPSALTGANYQVQFSVAGGATTYTVTKNGVATALANQPYVSGQAVQFDGMAVTVNGTPGNGDAFNVTPATPNLSVFGALDRVANALQVPGQTQAQWTQAAQFGLRDVDAVMNRVSAYRSDAGEVLNRTDTIEKRISETKLTAQTERSKAEDLDMVQGVSDFQTKQSGYDAALKTYAMVQRMSLLQYINA